jgi:hypothetical protein
MDGAALDAFLQCSPVAFVRVAPLATRLVQSAYLSESRYISAAFAMVVFIGQSCRLMTSRRSCPSI